MSASTPQSAPGRRLPGEVGIWVFILGDMLNFSILFSIFLYYRSLDPAGFTESQTHLRQDLAILNTLLLLTSSWLVAMALSFARDGRWQAYRRALVGAILPGSGFIAVKAVEYTEKAQQGISLLTNDFFMYYYIITVIHLLHVVVGLGMLTFLAMASRKREGGPSIVLIEGGGVYWHMVDFLWIIIFALLYLMR